jgi:hypothetical protein
LHREAWVLRPGRIPRLSAPGACAGSSLALASIQQFPKSRGLLLAQAVRDVLGRESPEDSVAGRSTVSMRSPARVCSRYHGSTGTGLVSLTTIPVPWSNLPRLHGLPLPAGLARQCEDQFLLLCRSARRCEAYRVAGSWSKSNLDRNTTGRTITNLHRSNTRQPFMNSPSSLFGDRDTPARTYSQVTPAQDPCKGTKKSESHADKWCDDKHDRRDRPIEPCHKKQSEKKHSPSQAGPKAALNNNLPESILTWRLSLWHPPQYARGRSC